MIQILSSDLISIVIGSITVYFILYLLKKINHIIQTLNEHERLFYGEKGTDLWNGLVPLVIKQVQQDDIQRNTILSIIEYLNKMHDINTNSELYRCYINLKNGFNKKT